MASIKPFPAYRPLQELAQQVAALPYDVYNREEARQAVKGHPLSFLNIDRPETQFDQDVSTYDERVYQKAKDMLWQWIEQGIYVQDPKPYYYLYELTMEHRVQTGIVACASIDDYIRNVIKKHENTREEKEMDRIKHVSVCEAQTGPIFLAYRAQPVLKEVICKTKTTTQPVFDFAAEDGITHRVWVVCEKEDIDTINHTFSAMEQLYIADGHHRCASAVKVGLKQREAHPDYTGKEAFNFFLSVLFSDDELMIMDYNRVVKDLNGLTEEQFLQKMEQVCDISLLDFGGQKPTKKGQMAMKLKEHWYLVTFKSAYLNEDPVNGLDVALLQNLILQPILNIQDPKTDKRIDFVGGIRGMKELEKRVETDCAVAFAMFPTSIQELFCVADAELLMPPKSTWFEPKLRSGLFIHTIREM